MTEEPRETGMATTMTGEGLGIYDMAVGGKIGRAISSVGSRSVGRIKGSVGCEGCSKHLQGAAVDSFV